MFLLPLTFTNVGSCVKNGSVYKCITLLIVESVYIMESVLKTLVFQG